MVENISVYVSIQPVNTFAIHFTTVIMIYLQERQDIQQKKKVFYQELDQENWSLLHEKGDGSG